MLQNVTFFVANVDEAPHEPPAKNVDKEMFFLRRSVKTSVAGERTLSYCISYRQGGGHRTFTLNWMAPYLPLFQFPIAVTPVRAIHPFSTTGHGPFRGAFCFAITLIKILFSTCLCPYQHIACSTKMR